MIPQAHAAHPPPPSRVDVVVREGSEPDVFMQAFDDRGAPWAGAGLQPVHIETNRAASQLEIYLVASFTWMHDGPSPRIATIKVIGWSPDSDYLLTPADAVTRCHGKGTAIIVKIPAKILT